MTRSSYLIRIPAGEVTARRIAALCAECLDPPPPSAAAAGPDGRWQVEIHFDTRPDLARLRALIIAAGAAEAAAGMRLVRLRPRDWVRSTLAGLVPVSAGRFVVHGAHDRDRVPPRCVAIEIEAGRAFGTGHHGTTRGCLVAIDGLARLHRPRHILDLGTGSGVLAIAAAKCFHMPVLATDIDAASARIARENARLNGVGDLVTVVNAAGLNARPITTRAPYDLVLANILLAPLMRLAAPIARALAPNAHVVLSGLLAQHAHAALAAYRTQGLVLMRRITIDNWTTLVLRAESRYRG